MSSGPELDRVYDEHAQALFAFLLVMTRSEADCRDLLQEVFVRLARRPELLAEVREPRAFLLRLAYNLAVDRARRAVVRDRVREAFAAERVELFAPTSDPDAAVFRAELAAALGGLPVEQRTVVHLKLWEGLTFEAIAATLGISINTAASRYRYGLDKLRQRLRPLYEEIR